MNGYQNDFPVIKNRSHEQDFIYLDSAATCLMPNRVINKVVEYMTHCGANPYRGASVVSEEATILCDESRKTIAYFLGVRADEVIFCRGTTDGLNLISNLLELNENEWIVNTVFEHHANHLPWKMNSSLISVGMTSLGEVDLIELESVLSSKQIKLVTLTYASNVMGIVQPVEQAIKLAHQYGAKICIDAAQVVSHFSLKLSSIQPDFLVFSGHKMFAMKGIGILYINKKIQGELRYKRFGGGMVNTVTRDVIEFKQAPLGFEPGTPSVESIISLGAACDYIQSIGWDKIYDHGQQWSDFFLSELNASDFELLLSSGRSYLPIFTLKHKSKNVDYSRLARTLSDTFNIMVNDGQQCCGPLYEYFNQANGLRVSGQIYNSLEQIKQLFNALNQLSLMM